MDGPGQAAFAGRRPECGQPTASPERSGRFRELLQPLGIGDEMRAAFCVTWCLLGARAVFIATGTMVTFTADEAEVLARIAPHLADGFRRALMLGAANGGESGPA